MVVSNVWGLYPDLEKQSNWINIFRLESTSQMKYIKHIGVCTCHFLYARVDTMNPFSCFHHDDLHSVPSTFVALSREKKNLQVPTTQPACATTMATGFDFGTESVRMTQGESAWICRKGKPLNLEDLSCPKDLGPSNGRVWTCIAGIRSSK